ncbi:MAG: YfhO family protein [Anaerolineae bacterium]|nr:YfhO family protein [Anaerolineae bacterium]
MALAVAAFGGWIAVAALLTLGQPLAPAHSARSTLWRAAVLLVVTLDLAWFAAGLNPTVPASFFERRGDAGPPGRVYWFDAYQYDVTFGTDEDETPSVEGFFDVGDYRIAGRRREELRASLLPNLNLLDRVPSLDNNDPLLPAVHRRYVALVEELGAGAGALLRAAGVTRAFGVTPDGWTGAAPAVAPGADGATAWLVRVAKWRESDEAISAALRDPAWDPAQTVILADISPPGSAGEGGRGAAASSPGSISLLKGYPAERRFHVTTGAPSYLVLAETWYPGWSATVDGAPAPILRANLAFQAVAVPAGKSEIVFRYRISNFEVGMVISAGALLAALALLLGGRIRRSRTA